jgi:hypothetical protein
MLEVARDLSSMDDWDHEEMAHAQVSLCELLGEVDRLDHENAVLVDHLLEQAAGRDEEAKRASLAEWHIARMAPAHETACAVMDRQREGIDARDRIIATALFRISAVLASGNGTVETARILRQVHADLAAIVEPSKDHA